MMKNNTKFGDKDDPNLHALPTEVICANVNFEWFFQVNWWFSFNFQKTKRAAFRAVAPRIAAHQKVVHELGHK